MTPELGIALALRHLALRHLALRHLGSATPSNFRNQICRGGAGKFDFLEPPGWGIGGVGHRGLCATRARGVHKSQGPGHQSEREFVKSRERGSQKRDPGLQSGRLNSSNRARVADQESRPKPSNPEAMSLLIVREVFTKVEVPESHTT